MKNIKEILREELSKINTKLVSAFPGCGKSHYFKNTKKNVLDSDSSTFDKKEFPSNYIKHIKENIGKVDTILISSHEEVRDALVENNLDFTLVYPEISIKDEYLKRYKDRGNEDKFVEMLDENWDEWLSDMKKQKGCEHLTLKSGEFLSDKLNDEESD